MFNNKNNNTNTNNNELNVKKYKYVVERKHSKVLFISSFFFGLNSIYGFYNYLHHNMKFNEIIFTNTILFLTSINYWRKPIYGFRRNLDITIAVINFGYNHYVIYNCHYSWIYYLAMKGIVVFYGLSRMYHNKNSNLACFFHCMVHISANVGNLAVFSGLINPSLY